jgi:chitin disaccharide deacetylase
MRQKSAIPSLVITADDYGYRPSYNRGILEAARGGAIDAASAMVEREFCDPERLLATGIEIGLHLELPATPRRSRASPGERDAAIAALRAQLSEFEASFGRPPAYVDGHHHCHAREGLGAAIGREAGERGLAVRSVNQRHRRLLRCLGVLTQDRLVGREEPSEPALPDLIEGVLDGSAEPPPGVTEWMVHPGYRDPDRASSYDAAREEDLGLVIEVRDALERHFRRAGHSVLTGG